MNRVCLAFATATLLGCATTPRPPPAAPAAPAASAESVAPPAPVDPLAEYRARLSQAADLCVAEDWASADAILRPASQAPELAQLPVDAQRWVLSAAANTALHLGRRSDCHDLSVRATTLPGAGPREWLLRFVGAAVVGDTPDAVASLTVLARTGPAELAQIPGEHVAVIADEAVRLDLPAEQDEALLLALFDARWKTEGGQEPSWLWRRLALHLLARGDLERARATVARIDEPINLVAIRADRRFDPLGVTRADVDRALARRLAETQARVRAEPRSLAAVNGLAHQLVVATRRREALRVTARVLDDLDRAAVEFDDPDELAWTMNQHADTLWALGRFGEAARWLERSAALPEQGGQNTSQIINLANLLCAQGRPREALAALERVGSRSPYGRMQAESVRACAAAQLNDAPALAASLAYLEEHRADAPYTLLHVLVAVGRLDGAAQLLLEDLQDPRRRSSALLWVQDFAPSALTKVEARSDAAWNALLRRPDVRAAIAAVGRRERYQIEWGGE